MRGGVNDMFMFTKIVNRGIIVLGLLLFIDRVRYAG